MAHPLAIASDILAADIGKDLSQRTASEMRWARYAKCTDCGNMFLKATIRGEPVRCVICNEIHRERRQRVARNAAKRKAYAAKKK